ncbi:MAG TPA: 2-amino-4-hydroxy-6-hydroxymethyldihydropteridine diphosphokinase [Tepidisphaeraceae bacterium]|jgi:2-amino-4-hydroxy-6-hydroxymethyldihydropteridine diphosphokinase|nr:2-amino-4-hydroxy-6-hydroxymethyldihydropteridine diphosphokinase [Tepidisphaeraceae bacterium]
MRNQAEVAAYIALGANLGDRRHNIHAALAQLKRTDGISVVRVSTLLENPAVGGPPDSPPFLNAAAELKTNLGSHALLHCLLGIERKLGRVRRQRWEPRPIDMDLLLYGDQIISSQELVVPHPLMHERRFVLQPLAEIAPEAVHPVLQMTIAGLLENLDREARASGTPR